MANSWGNSWLASWANSWGLGSVPSAPSDTRDIFETTPDQWKNYRERLLSLSQSSEQFLQSRYIKERINEHIEEIQVLDNEIRDNVLKSGDADISAKFYQSFKSELSMAIEKLNKMLIKMEIDEEDDLHSIILLSGGL